MTLTLGNSSKPAKSRDLRHRPAWETFPSVTLGIRTSAANGVNSTLLAAGLRMPIDSGTDFARK